MGDVDRCGHEGNVVRWYRAAAAWEFFRVIDGQLTIRMDDGDVTLGPGQVYVVRKGTVHQPFSADGAAALLLEPSQTVNTGDTPSDLTASRRVL